MKAIGAMAIFVVYGLLSILFAFVRPPAALERMFAVPSIFVFLPDRWIVPVGRFFVGILCLGVTALVVIKTS